MGELQRDPIDLLLDDRPPGLVLTQALMSEHPPGAVLSQHDFKILREALETCAGADNCHHCAHQVECSKFYDALVERTK